MTSDRSKRIAVACLLCLLSATPALGLQDAQEQQQDIVEEDPTEYGLPEHTEPVSYELHVRPTVDPVNGTYAFSGHVEIVISAVSYTTEVVLNSKDLIVSSVSGFEDVDNGRNRTVPVESFEYDVPREWLVIALARSLLPNRHYRFTVQFSGTLRDDFTGFHKYFYDSADKSRWIALTQFKPVYARRAFPCYDEPKFKTPFKISIDRKVKHFSLSNMPLILTQIDPRSGWACDHFETTKPVPTFLVAFMVSDFDKNALNDESIALYTRREFIEYTSYMMRKVPQLLEGVERFTQIQYMLPKLDLVGVPLLDAYNMENWGLNSYEEFYVTLSNSSQTEDKIAGTMTVLHAILHQWFGNMVTTPSWDYSWLNEGICNYLNYYITDTIEPEWELHERFVEDVHQRALAWDQYDDAHPLTFSLRSPYEIINGFDAITTDKSAALFRMLKHAVGESYFKMSWNKYLEDFAYAEAGPKDLWNAFDNVLYDSDFDIDDGITVNRYMRLWTEQAGFPLINVESANDGSAVVVTQKRFSLSIPRQTDDAKWFVGLTYTTEKTGDFDQVTPTVWLKPEDEQKVIPVPTGSGWMIFNIQSTGFYRVNYDEKNWKLLLIQLITKPDRIHVLNRAQIVDDAYHLSRAGVVPYDYYISLLEYLLMEDHVVPWNTAVNGLSATLDGLRGHPTELRKFEEYANGLADILYDKLAGNKLDNESTKIGWSKLFAWTCKLGNSRCRKSALQRFDAWTSGNGIPSEIEEAAFCEGMKKGGFTAWSKMYKFYSTAQSPSHRKIALRALACAENVQMLFNRINLLRLDGASPVSAKNFKMVFENFATTPQGVRALVEFLSHKLDAILALNDGHQLATFAYSVLASKVATDIEMKTMNKIRASAGSAGLKAAFDEEHKKIEWNLKWINRDLEKIIKAIGK